jgi:hypothetical protein
LTPFVTVLSSPSSSWISLRLIVPSPSRERSVRAAAAICLAV